MSVLLGDYIEMDRYYNGGPPQKDDQTYFDALKYIEVGGFDTYKVYDKEKIYPQYIITFTNKQFDLLV